MADLSVYDKKRTMADYMRQQAEDDFNRNLAQKKLEKLSAGGDDPAAIKIVNDLQKAAQDANDPSLGEIERKRAAHRYVLLSQVAKSYNADRGIEPTLPNYGQLGGGMTAQPSGKQTLPNVFLDVQQPEDYDLEQQLQLDAGQPPQYLEPLPVSGVRETPGYGAIKARQAGQKKAAEEQAAKSVDLNMNPQIEGAVTKAKKTGEEIVARQAAFTKTQSALNGFEQQANLVTKNIDNALGILSGWSTGYGSMLSAIPNTDARKLKNYLDTIKANIGFDKLQSMRENSPTGGALGAISDMENRLLQAVSGALDPGQEDQLRDNLFVIRDLYPQVLAEKKRAFEQDYGAFGPLGGAPQRPAQPQSGPRMGDMADGYVYTGGDPASPSSWKKVR